MPFKDLNKRRAYRMRWYSAHKVSEIAHVQRRKKEIRKWFWDYKKSLKCSICGEQHPAIIDFHHKEGKKENSIAQMVVYGYSLDRIKQELIKCEVVCSNCHRKIHARNNKL